MIRETDLAAVSAARPRGATLAVFVHLLGQRFGGSEWTPHTTVDLIAAAVGYHRSTIQRALRQLETIGWIVSEMGCGRGDKSRFCVLPEGGEKGRAGALKGRAGAQKGRAGAQKGRAGAAPSISEDLTEILTAAGPPIDAIENGVPEVPSPARLLQRSLRGKAGGDVDVTSDSLVDADADARLRAAGIDPKVRPIAELFARAICDGQSVPPSALKPEVCDAMLVLGRVTCAQLRALGVPGYRATRAAED